MTDEALVAALEVDESFTVVRVLAQHKVGATELVRSPQGTLCVRKRIPLELSNRNAWEKLATLRSPLLPRVERLYELPDQLVVVCQYVAGTSMAELLESGASLSPIEAAAIAGGVCDALAVLHDAGIVHRDVSPGNVILAPDVVGGNLRSRVRLIDLGVARVEKDRASHDTRPLGTRGFSAPEQYGFAQTDGRSDLYSAGRLLLCMLCGSLVDDVAPDLDDLMARHGIPLPLRDVVRRACAFEPSARYQDAREMSAALEQAEFAMEEAKRTTPGAYARTSPHTGSPSQPHGMGSFRKDPPAASVATNATAMWRNKRHIVLRLLMGVNLLLSMFFAAEAVYAFVVDRAEYFGAIIVCLAIMAAATAIAWFIHRYIEEDTASEEAPSMLALVGKIVLVVLATFVCVLVVALATAAAAK